MAIDFTPRHCQALMRDWIINHNRCNVWASPGTGKTGATYCALDLLKLLGSQFFPALVLAPKRVAVDVWPREQKKWNQFADLKVVCLADREDEFDRIEQLRRKADVYIVNYDLLTARYQLNKKTGKMERRSWGLIDHFIEKKLEWPFRTVIADESTKLKGFRLRGGSKRSMALARMQKHVGRWINLTGTPAPNGLIDLWGQCWFLDRGERLGRTFGEFKQRWFIENPYSGVVEPRAGAEAEIAAKLNDITLAIRAEDYFDLPPVVPSFIRVELKPKARQLYERFQSEMFAEIEGKSIEALNSAAVSGKCLQMASGAVYVTEDGEYVADPNDPRIRGFVEVDDSKLTALEDLLDEMAGEPLLVAYHWKFDALRIKEKFPFAQEIKSTESIDAWNAKRIKLGLIHPASAGHGIDLAVGGHHLAFFDHWWDLEHYMQVIERIGPTRQSQHNMNRPVFLHYIVAARAIDEDVIERREGKQAVQDDLIERMRK